MTAYNKYTIASRMTTVTATAMVKCNEDPFEFMIVSEYRPSCKNAGVAFLDSFKINRISGDVGVDFIDGLSDIFGFLQ